MVEITYKAFSGAAHYSYHFVNFSEKSMLKLNSVKF